MLILDTFEKNSHHQQYVEQMILLMIKSLIEVLIDGITNKTNLNRS